MLSMEDFGAWLDLVKEVIDRDVPQVSSGRAGHEKTNDKGSGGYRFSFPPPPPNCLAYRIPPPPPGPLKYWAETISPRQGPPARPLNPPLPMGHGPLFRGQKNGKGGPQ